MPDDDDFDQFGMDDDDDLSRGMSSNAKSGSKGIRHNADEEDAELELRPVKAGRTFLFGAVDNGQ